MRAGVCQVAGMLFGTWHLFSPLEGGSLGEGGKEDGEESEEC